MRVLLLKRQLLGGANTDASTLSRFLPRIGVDAQVVDASDWMPAATGSGVDRAVSRRLRDLGTDCDLIHAFGYRCSWACAEAFRREVPWISHLSDPPKTNNSELTTRLDMARLRLAASETVLREVVAAGVTDCEMLVPGVDVSGVSTMDRASARSLFGWDERSVVLGLGPLNGYQSLAKELRGKTHARLVLFGEGSCSEFELGEGQTVSPPTQRPLEAIVAADLVILPHPRSGFSRTIAESQLLGTPVLARNQPAFREQVSDEVSGFLYSDDQELADVINRCLDSPLTGEVVRRNGLAFATERYSPERFATDAASAYGRAIHKG